MNVSLIEWIRFQTPKNFQILKSRILNLRFIALQITYINRLYCFYPRKTTSDLSRINIFGRLLKQHKRGAQKIRCKTLSAHIQMFEETHIYTRTSMHSSSHSYWFIVVITELKSYFIVLFVLSRFNGNTFCWLQSSSLPTMW